LLDQARVRDGAFDIGMFRSYWERAARVTGGRIADLSARPLTPSTESTDSTAAPPRDLRPSPEASSGEPSDAPVEALSHLSGLISRVLESADQLADSTRRTRRGTKVPAAETGTRQRTTE
jgi:hypothetical protein